MRKNDCGFSSSLDAWRRLRPSRLAASVGAVVLVAGVFGAGVAQPAVHAATTCTPTGFVRDGINMTAAIINPTAPVTGPVDAAGCNIGVYFNSGQGAVTRADIHGANYFGVVVDGDINAVSVDVTNSTIHDIGETPPNGSQHGVAIYYRNFGSGAASGNISGNMITRYQKGGIVANGTNTHVSVTDNTVTGLGRVNFIAQNGIQIGFGADAMVMKNTVRDNAYTGLNDAASAGILVVGGLCNGSTDYTVGTQVVGNTLTNNDVGIYLTNLDANCSAPSTATNVKAINNTISNDALSNRCCSSDGDIGYQAGVSDVGNNDKIINNTISGDGYSATAHPGAAFAVDADPSFTNRAKVHADK